MSDDQTSVLQKTVSLIYLEHISTFEMFLVVIGCRLDYSGGERKSLAIIFIDVCVCVCVCMYLLVVAKFVVEGQVAGH